ncbi:uncharacterized protein V6R79_021383 [Siganus canaliculatus]
MFPDTSWSLTEAEVRAAEPFLCPVLRSLPDTFVTSVEEQKRLFLLFHQGFSSVSFSLCSTVCRSPKLPAEGRSRECQPPLWESMCGPSLNLDLGVEDTFDPGKLINLTVVGFLIHGQNANAPKQSGIKSPAEGRWTPLTLTHL